MKWAAEDGANISEGDTVLVLEAMKMETPVRAHRSGTLTRGEPNEGDAVRKGQALGEIAFSDIRTRGVRYAGPVAVELQGKFVFL